MVADKFAPDEADLDATLKAIRDAYLARLPERLNAIDESLQQYEAQPGSATHFETLLRHMHSLAGSAGTFGLAELGMRATEIELMLNAYGKSDAPGADDFAPIAAETRALLRLAAAERNPH